MTVCVPVRNLAPANNSDLPASQKCQTTQIGLLTVHEVRIVKESESPKQIASD